MYEVEITFGDGHVISIVAESLTGTYGAEAIREEFLDAGCRVIIFDRSPSKTAR
jgi:hypothetical protein